MTKLLTTTAAFCAAFLLSFAIVGDWDRLAVAFVALIAGFALGTLVQVIARASNV